MSIQNDLVSLRKELHRRYELLESIKSKLEFNDADRKLYRFQRYLKRKTLFTPHNEESLHSIPLMYRFRFYGYVNPLIDILLADHNARIKTLNDLGMQNGSETKELYKEQLAMINNDLYNIIIASTETVKVPFVIDIRSYDPDVISNNIIGINDSYLSVYLTEHNMDRLKRLRRILGNEDKINQMLQSSKVLASSYNRYKSRTF